MRLRLVLRILWGLCCLLLLCMAVGDCIQFAKHPELYPIGSEGRQINLVITKDLSRLGRNYLQTGHLIEDFFPRNVVRYIAMNDGIDTLRDNNDIAPFKNILNEMNISSTRRRAYKATTNSRHAHQMCIRDRNDTGFVHLHQPVALIIAVIFLMAAGTADGFKTRKYIDFLQMK